MQRSRQSATVAAVVALENANLPALTETLGNTDISLWPLLRWPLIAAMSSVELGWETVAKRTARRKTWARTARQLAPHPSASLFRAPRAEHVFYASGERLIPTPSGLRHPLIHEHADGLDEALILLDRPIDRTQHPEDQPAFSPTLSYDDLIVRAEVKARLRPPPKVYLEHALAMAAAILDQTDVELPPERAAGVLREFTLRVRRARHLRDLHNRLLDTVQPRVAYVHQAAYGGDRAVLVTELHRRGVIVAEHQHGWVGPAHGAYNYGAAAWHSPLRRSLPDYFLTFGSYWSDAVSGPWATTEVGRPSFEARIAATRPLADRPKRILFASSVSDPASATSTVLRLRDALPVDWSIAFRPHPREIESLGARYPRLIGASRILIDTEPDLYTSLSSVRAVYGISSTVLYEALALGCTVGVRNSAFTDFYIDRARMPVFEDDAPIDSLVAHLTGPPHAHKVEDLFARDALARMSTFSNGL